MNRDDLRELHAFATVAKERSFTKAAARLGVSQSALSHTIRNLEARHHIKLLTRTTRNVSPTEAGSRLLHTLQPVFSQLKSALDELHYASTAPSGTVRITTGQHLAHSILWPCIQQLSQK